MYRPKAFDVTDPDEIHRALDAAGPAHLVSMTDHGLTASVVPMVLDRDTNALVGHLARANRHWRDVRDDVETMAIFAGPDAYISPNWYATKAATGKVVPTWNYEVIHVYGHLVAHDDPVWLEQLVRRLTERHEARFAAPWSVDDAPPDFIAGQLRAIGGIELRITRIEAKSKLSQNRNEADAAGAIAGLAEGSPTERVVAERMRSVLA